MVEKGRPVGAGVDPRGPSAALRMTPLLKKVTKTKAKTKASATATATATAKVKADSCGTTS